MSIVVRYFAAARHAAGRDEESLDLPAAGTLGTVLQAIGERHGDSMIKVLARCSFLLDEVAVTVPARTVHDGATLDVLPPFAGG